MVEPADSWVQPHTSTRLSKVAPAGGQLLPRIGCSRSCFDVVHQVKFVRQAGSVMPCCHRRAPQVLRARLRPASSLHSSRSCWTSATGQAGTLLLARVLDSTSATRWVGIVVDRRNDYKQMHRDIIAGDENVSTVGFKTPLHVLCRQSRCLCVEMFLVTLLVVCFSFDN